MHLTTRRLLSIQEFTVDPLAGTTGEEPPVSYMHVTVNEVDVSSR